MFDEHDPYLVALSVAIAILGGYTGFGLAARIRQRPDAEHRVLLVGAAAFLAIGIWTMHFVGMLAAPIPADAAYLVLPTVISFLICALVVGISVFFVTVSAPSQLRIVSAAVLLGAGIASMHYVGMHSLSGHFSMQHDASMVALSVLIAIGAAYGGLRVFLARPAGIQLFASAAAFGIAVSGMHYTAMYGVHFGTMPYMWHHHMEGLVASQQILSLVVAVLCFVVAAGFLLSLVPDPRRHRSVSSSSEAHNVQVSPVATADDVQLPVISSAITASQHVASAPPGRSGEPRAAAASRLPVEGSDGTHFIISSDVRSIRADAHYTRIHDGTRERMCLWSISEAETQLDPDSFIRVHRSYIVGLCHVSFVRKEGDGAVIELDGPSPHRIPVSRAKIAEVKIRLGLAKRASQASPSPQ
jgi:NO-binding membrane sensor protein with MHYT domain